MANRLQFKRGNGAPTAGILQSAEPAYDLSADLLYIGTGDSDVQIIGGKSYVDRVDSFLKNLNDIDIKGTSDFGGAATFASSVSITGGVLMSSTLGVTGKGTFEADVEVKSGLAVSGGSFTLASGVAVSSILDEDDMSSDSATALATQQSIKKYVDTVVTGGGQTINIVDLNASGNANIDGTLDVELGANFQSTLTVAGLTDLNGALEVQGAATFSSTMQVDGNTNIDGTLDVTLATTLDNTLDVAEKATFAKVVQVLGNTDLDGELDVAQAARLASTLDVTGATTLSNTLEVTGATTLSDTLEVTGNSDLNGQLDVQGATNLQNSLTVAGASDLNSTLNVQGAATFQDTVRIEGNLEVAGTATEISFQVRDVAIEDRLIELGMEAGAAPSTATDWDLGIAMNYHSGGSAKKSAVVWTDNTGFNLAAEVTETQTAGANDPQIAVDAFAGLGVNSVHIGDVTGGNTTAVIDSNRDASLNELYIGDVIGTAGNKFAAFDGTFVQLTNTAFDGGSY